MPPTAPVIPQSQIIFVYLMVGLVVAGTILMLILKLLIWLGDRHDGVTYEWQTPAPREPTRLGAWAGRLAEDAEARHAPRRVMPSAGDGGRAVASGTLAVYVPVSQYDMPSADMDTAPAIAAPVAPDIDAPNAGMPRVSSKMSAASLIALLASLRGPDGKPQFSANAIFSFVGGDRNAVLATVREIRSGPPTPVFPPLTPEQQQNRDALGLNAR